MTFPSLGKTALNKYPSDVALPRITFWFSLFSCGCYENKPRAAFHNAEDKPHPKLQLNLRSGRPLTCLRAAPAMLRANAHFAPAPLPGRTAPAAPTRRAAPPPPAAGRAAGLLARRPPSRAEPGRPAAAPQETPAGDGGASPSPSAPGPSRPPPPRQLSRAGRGAATHRRGPRRRAAGAGSRGRPGRRAARAAPAAPWPPRLAGPGLGVGLGGSNLRSAGAEGRERSRGAAAGNPPGGWGRRRAAPGPPRRPREAGAPSCRAGPAEGGGGVRGLRGGPAAGAGRRAGPRRRRRRRHRRRGRGHTRTRTHTSVPPPRHNSPASSPRAAETAAERAGPQLRNGKGVVGSGRVGRRGVQNKGLFSRNHPRPSLPRVGCAVRAADGPEERSYKGS